MKKICKDTFIHPTARVDHVKVGSGTKIWYFSHICNEAIIGKNCVIGQNVYIGPKVTIGSGCKIQNNVFIPEGVVLKDDVFIGPSVTFTNIKVPRAFIDQKDTFETTIVEHGASIGANATILCGITIGQYAMIGAGTVVLENVWDNELVVGNPGRVIGIVNPDGSTCF